MTPSQRAELRALAKREPVPFMVATASTNYLRTCSPEVIEGLLNDLDAAEQVARAAEAVKRERDALDTTRLMMLTLTEDNIMRWANAMPLTRVDAGHLIALVNYADDLSRAVDKWRAALAEHDAQGTA